MTFSELVLRLTKSFKTITLSKSIFSKSDFNYNQIFSNKNTKFKLKPRKAKHAVLNAVTRDSQTLTNRDFTIDDWGRKIHHQQEESKGKNISKKLIDVRFEPVTISFKSVKKSFQQLIFREFSLYLVEKVIIDS